MNQHIILPHSNSNNNNSEVNERHLAASMDKVRDLVKRAYDHYSRWEAEHKERGNGSGGSGGGGSSASGSGGSGGSSSGASGSGSGSSSSSNSSASGASSAGASSSGASANSRPPSSSSSTPLHPPSRDYLSSSQEALVSATVLLTMTCGFARQLGPSMQQYLMNYVVSGLRDKCVCQCVARLLIHPLTAQHPSLVTGDPLDGPPYMYPH